MLKIALKNNLFSISICFRGHQKVPTPSNFRNLQKVFIPFNSNEESKYAEDYQFAQGFDQVDWQQNRISAGWGREQPQSNMNLRFRGKMMSFD